MSQDVADVTFEEIGLMPELLEAVAKVGFETPTRIQASAIPPALDARDVLGCAHTGSGKTAAFSLPTIQRILKEPLEPGPKEPVALMLAPTRELVMQIQETIDSFGQDNGIRTVNLVGGMNINPQIRGLEAAPHIAVATPGRLLDHLRQRTVSFKRVKVFVLDEADRMLDMGFQDQLDAILRKVPKRRQTLLFSATIDTAISELVRTSVQDPVHADTTDEIQEIPAVELNWVEITERRKRKKLFEVVENEDGTMLVFVNMKSRARITARALSNAGVAATDLHGGLDQKERLRALNAFKSGKIRVLVATDVAARGIDIESIAHVVNYDMPYAPEDFIHRIGRTARAGAEGTATNFVTVGDREIAKRVLRMLESKRAAAEPEVAEEDKPKKFGRKARRVQSRRGPKSRTKLF